MKTINNFKIKPNQTAVISGIVTQAYLDKYNPSIVHFPAYSISLIQPKIQAVSSNALKNYLIYKIKTNPKQPGITASYKPAIHPKHPILTSHNLAKDFKPGAKAQIKLKALTVKFFEQPRLSLMLVKIRKLNQDN